MCAHMHACMSACTHAPLQTYTHAEISISDDIKINELSLKPNVQVLIRIVCLFVQFELIFFYRNIYHYTILGMLLEEVTREAVSLRCNTLHDITLILLIM
jgi:hypothetical protein